ncbi:MAG: hypothetical protein FIA97_01235 [Methylococcaceae bacterium]|nr:hypothetical protein [Methylococcaceae bacterium]
MKTAAFRLSLAIGILALVLLAIDAAWHGVAAARALPGQVARDAWLRNPTLMGLWTDAYMRLSAAARMDRDNPQLTTDVGMLTAELALQPGASRLSAALRRESLEAFRTAIRQRPTWPFAWGQIAVLKYNLGEFDQEFFEALRRTAQLGPAEPDLQRMVVEIGLGEWARLGPEERAAVTGMLRRGLEMDRAGMVGMIQRTGKRPLVCETTELRRLAPELVCDS